MPEVRLSSILLASALAAVTLAAAPRGARAQLQIPVVLDLHSPPEMLLTDSWDLPVEGRVLQPDFLEELELSVNGGRIRTVAVEDGLFADEVELEEGANLVRIGPVTRRVWLDAGDHPPPPGYKRVYGHLGLDDSCLECHEVGEGGRLPLAAGRDELCLWCHADLVRGRLGVPWASVHAPVAKGRCLGCHAPHASERKGLPAEKVPECRSCHEAVSARLSTDRYVHGPMNIGDCGICHAVHASAQPRLLARPATELCTDCHSDALPREGTPERLRPHAMIPEGECGRCHEPHSSQNAGFLRLPAGRLCHECHEGKTRSFHEAKGFSIYICSRCHDLHRPNQPHLIVDASRSLCTKCHDFSGEAAFRHSFVEEGRCFLCHSFHEAPLQGTIAETCLPCHRESPALPGAHGGIAFEGSDCTRCHLPHRSGRAKLMMPVEHQPFADRECGACHEERAALLGGEYRDLCTGCHGEKDLARRDPPPAQVHPPFAESDCSACHRSHAGTEPGLLPLAQLRLCLDCHRKMRKATILTPTSSHRDVVEGRCGSCHDPHFAGAEALLRAPAPELCPSCHGGLVAGPGGEPWPVPHQPVAEGKCRLCHRAHTSGTPALLRSRMPRPCRPCHGELARAIEESDPQSVHAPVRDGRCEACHRVHGAGEPALLAAAPGEGLCGSCHRPGSDTHHGIAAAELEARPGGSGAAARACLHCHRPHLSDGRRLLLPLRSAVCAGCHKG